MTSPATQPSLGTLALRIMQCLLQRFAAGTADRSLRLIVTPRQKKLLWRIIVALLLISGALVCPYYFAEHGNATLLGARWLAFDPQSRLLFTYQDNVYRLDLATDELTPLIRTGRQASFDKVADITVAPDGTIYQSDPDARRIAAYSAAGTLLRTVPGHFAENGKLAATTDHILVADMQWSDKRDSSQAQPCWGRVLALAPQSGVLLWENRNFQIPDSIHCSGDTVFVSDMEYPSGLNHGMIRMFNARTGTVGAVILVESPLTDYYHGSTVIVTPGGEVLLLPIYHPGAPLRVYALSGELLRMVRLPEECAPTDIAAARNGDIIISDDEHFRLWRLAGDRVHALASKSLDRLFGSQALWRRISGWLADICLTVIVAFLLMAAILLVCYLSARAVPDALPATGASVGGPLADGSGGNDECADCQRSGRPAEKGHERR